ncbi:MAG: hypothetical protein PF448_08540, partial [Bacteroidales bacterium]|nr:hypothetical protein [Bacteroidales bacterium]
MFGHSPTSAFDNVYEGFTAIAANPYNSLEVYIGYTKVIGSNNINTTNFAYISPYNGNGFHADVHALAFPPNINSQELFCGHDGGVSVKDLTSSGIGGWTARYDGLQVGTIWTFDDYDCGDEHYIALGHQDCAHSFLDQATGVWETKFGGDGYGSQFDDNTGILFAKNNSGFQSYYPLTNSSVSELAYLPDDPAYNTAMVPTTFKLVNHPITERPWFGFTELYERKEDAIGGLTWADIWDLESDALKSEWAKHRRQIVDINISPADPNYIYFSTLGGIWIDPVSPPDNPLPSKLFFTKEGGLNNSSDAWNVNAEARFIDISEFLPQANGMLKRVIMGMDVDPNDSGVIYLALSGYDYGDKVVKMSLTETPTEDIWSVEDLDPNNSLPPININDIKYQYGSEGRLFVATDVGVYYKDNSTNGLWEIYGDIPHCRVVDIKLNHYNNKIRAATFGRGLWEADFPCEDIVIRHDQIWNFTKVLCANLEVNNGALFIVDELVLAPTSTVTVKDNSVLIVRDKIVLNSLNHLSILNNSHIIITEDAKLVINSENVDIQGDDSYLEIAGQLHIADNIVFTYTGDGYIKFSNPGGDATNNIFCGSGASIVLQGSGQNDKIMEVQQSSVRFPAELSSLELRDGKIEMGTDARMLAEVVSGNENHPIILDNIKITSDDGTYNNHRSFFFWGQPNITINDCVFEYGQFGLYNYTYWGAPLTVTNSTFRNNQTGLYMYDKGLTLTNCEFNNNTQVG